MTEMFLDTASIKEIDYWKQFDLVQGVTTNPALLAIEGVDPIERIKEIGSIIDGPISVEVTYTDPDKMVEHARALSDLLPNIIIKIPASLDGLKASKLLKCYDVKLNVTLIFHPTQAIPFIRSGVDYVSLFIGRVEDFGLSNYSAIKQIKRIITVEKSKTKLISASIRNPSYLFAAIDAESDVITVPPSTWEKVFNNPMFKLGEQEFLASWQSLSFDLRKTYENIEGDTIDAPQR